MRSRSIFCILLLSACFFGVYAQSTNDDDYITTPRSSHRVVGRLEKLAIGYDLSYGARSLNNIKQFSIIVLTSTNPRYSTGEELKKLSALLRKMLNDKSRVNTSKMKVRVTADKQRIYIHELNTLNVYTLHQDSLREEPRLLFPSIGGLNVQQFILSPDWRFAMASFRAEGSGTITWRCLDMMNAGIVNDIRPGDFWHGAFSPDGNHLVYIVYNNDAPQRVFFYDLKNKKELAQYGREAAQRVNNMKEYSLHRQADSLRVDDRYLYLYTAVVPNGKNNQPFVRIFDLLDHFKPAGWYYGTFKSGEKYIPDPAAANLFTPPESPVHPVGRNNLSALHQEMLAQFSFISAAKLNGFYRPVPGKLLDKKYLTIPGLQQQGADTYVNSYYFNFTGNNLEKPEIYALGNLHEDNRYAILLMAARSVSQRSEANPNGLNEMLSYQLKIYDKTLQKITDQRNLGTQLPYDAYRNSYFVELNIYRYSADEIMVANTAGGYSFRLDLAKMKFFP